VLDGFEAVAEVDRVPTGRSWIESEECFSVSVASLPATPRTATKMKIPAQLNKSG